MEFWKYAILFLLFIWVLVRTKKIIGHKRILGRRVTINYADQNMQFETIFPATGEIVKSIKIGNTKYFVLKLDKKFGYESVDYDTIAIKERIAGQAIGYDNETEVHVLLPKVQLTTDKYNFDQFDHVVWATLVPDKKT